MGHAFAQRSILLLDALAVLTYIKCRVTELHNSVELAGTCDIHAFSSGLCSKESQLSAHLALQNTILNVTSGLSKAQREDLASRAAQTLVSNIDVDTGSISGAFIPFHILSPTR